MTLAIWKNGIAAIDSLYTDSDTGEITYASKVIKPVDGMPLCFKIGDKSIGDILYDWVQETDADPEEWPGEVAKMPRGILVCFWQDCIVEYGTDDPWPRKLPYKEFPNGWAIGTGAEFALGMLHKRRTMTPVKAINEVAKRFGGVGGEVEWFKIGDI